MRKITLLREKIRSLLCIFCYASGIRKRFFGFIIIRNIVFYGKRNRLQTQVELRKTHQRREKQQPENKQIFHISKFETNHADEQIKRYNFENKSIVFGLRKIIYIFASPKKCLGR